MDAFDDEIHRRDAVGRTAHEKRQVLRVRHRRSESAAVSATTILFSLRNIALRAALRLDHQGPAARPDGRRDALVVAAVRGERRRRGRARRRTDARSARVTARSGIGAPSRLRNSTMTRSPCALGASQSRRRSIPARLARAPRRSACCTPGWRHRGFPVRRRAACGGRNRSARCWRRTSPERTGRG